MTTRSRGIALIALVLFITCVIATAVYAAGEGGEEGVVVKEKNTWFDLFKKTGFVGVLLLLVSIAGTALVIQNAVNIKAEKLMPPHLVTQVEELLSAQNIDEAYDLCKANNNYFCNIMGGGLERSFGGYEEIRAGVAEATSTEGFKLSAKISYLSLIGNLGPLIGLLGTVTGMITSFQKIEQMKAPTPGDLAAGVYESLVNTTMGLFVAIIFLTCQFIFKNKTTDLSLKINIAATDVLARTISPEVQKLAQSEQN